MLRAVPDPVPEQEFPELPDLQGAQITEDLVARLFAQRFMGKLAYCHSRGGWYEFNGFTWVYQRTPIAFHYARELCRRVSSSPGASVTQIQKTRFAGGVERYAQADPVFARTAETWDSDLYLLGTPGGTVDLRTGLLRSSRAPEHISKSTTVAPEEFADCTVWRAFLKQATGDDPALQRYLKQIAGYCLTGDTSEQCLFFVHGEGGRGKGTFINTLYAIMGDYVVPSAMETFEASKSLGHSTSIAMLNGARMVTASETEEGRAWAESRIKQFTGQDPITARFMRQDDFTFMPQFKLVIMGNYQPTLRTVDDAMRRRFNMIPFTIKPAKIDKNLQAKLRAEYPAILRWAIEGCIDWQQNGFVRPEIVVRSTNEYFDDQNTFGQWIEEMCRVDIDNPTLKTSATTLFAFWRDYAKSNGEEPGSQKTFGQSLARAGVPKKKTKNGIFYTGIEIVEKG